MKVYKSLWSDRPIVKEWTQPVQSGTMSGIKHMITYLDNKGKEKTMMKWVIWQKEIICV